MKTLVIPAYKPDEKLLGVIRDFRALSDARILVVNDGSGASFEPIFRQVRELGCTLLEHEVNRGKGAALKTAFSYLMEEGCQDVICTADADGQHLPKDILACLEEAGKNPGALIIGGRGFTGNVPLRSRVGNAFSRWTFFLFTGAKVYDTQTGLRAFSADLLPLVASVKGDRYEYEMQMLCDAAREKVPMREVRIETVYLEDNASSHFNALRDAGRVYAILLRNGCGTVYQILSFLLSSGLSFLVDLGLNALLFYWALAAVPEGLRATLSLLFARICSSLVNFTVNRKVVFKEGQRWRSFLGYVILAVAVYFGNNALNHLFLFLAWPYILCTLMSQVICYPVSFAVQKLFIFRNMKER